LGTEVRSMLESVGAGLVGALAPPVAASRTNVEVAALGLVSELESRKTVTARILARAGTLPEWLDPSWFDDGLVDPVMAAPIFRRAVYADLRELGQEYLVPGLERIPPNRVTLLQTNPRFVESFLIGLNHEFARELLWRGFPTDQRGTYFKWFWSTSRAEFSTLLHELSADALGSHGDEDPNRARVVLLVRGKLLLRYPGTHIYAARELEPAVEPEGPRRRLSSVHVEPLVQGRLAPDLTFVIFPLTIDEVAADPSWRFVLAENVTEPTFGFDELENVAPGALWSPGAVEGASVPVDDIAWAHVPFVTGTPFVDANTTDFPNVDGKALWGRNGAAMAHVAFQRPVRVVYEAPSMLTKMQVPDA
jgi:hypothetical protein